MKVAHIMAGARSGGAELFYERLSVALAGAGEEILPVIRRDAGRAARLGAAGLAPVQLRFGGALDVFTRMRLRRVLREFAPRVVVSWMSRATQHMPRGDWVLAGRLGGFYNLRNFRHCDHLIGNTHGLVEWIRGQGWPAGRVHYLPNFVPDLAGAAPAALDIPPGRRLVLALGRLHPVKGFDLLIRALPALPDVHLLIAGEGDERPALEALARREGVAERLSMPGWRSDTAALLAASELLVCSSRREPLGNVVLDGFSAHRPVVASAIDGPRELIASGENGLLVPVGDPPALAQAIRTVLDHPALAQRLAAAGRASYETGFAEAGVVARWQEFLQRMGGAG